MKPGHHKALKKEINVCLPPSLHVLAHVEKLFWKKKNVHVLPFLLKEVVYKFVSRFMAIAIHVNMQ